MIHCLYKKISWNFSSDWFNANFSVKTLICVINSDIVYLLAVSCILGIHTLHRWPVGSIFPWIIWSSLIGIINQSARCYFVLNYRTCPLSVYPPLDCYPSPIYIPEYFSNSRLLSAMQFSRGSIKYWPV